MDIVYSTDDNFFDIMLVSILSLLENNRNSFIHIWVLSDNISNVNKEKIAIIENKYSNSKINLLEFSNEFRELDLNLDRGSTSAYSRIFIARMLPSNLNKVLYLDCDTIILGNILNFYNISDFKGKVLFAVSDTFNSNYKKLLKIPIKSKMFNNGVMLINLKEWRNLGIEEKLISNIKKYKGYFIQGDLGLMNSVLYDKYFEISPKYNVMTSYYDFEYKDLIFFKRPYNYYSKEEIENSKKNTLIRHFTTSFMSDRPWIKNSEVNDLEYWNYYYYKLNDLSIKFSHQKNNNKKFYIIIIRKIINFKYTKSIVLFVLSIVQFYVRPVIFLFLKHSKIWRLL